MGKYWRSRPLVFSFVPRCHGLRGSQKKTCSPVSILQSWGFSSWRSEACRVRREGRADLGSELGAHVVPALGITGLSNDRASVCDEFINPQYGRRLRSDTPAPSWF